MHNINTHRHTKLASFLCKGPYTVYAHKGCRNVAIYIYTESRVVSTKCRELVSYTWQGRSNDDKSRSMQMKHKCKTFVIYKQKQKME